jgi:hypothetical protein
MSNKGNGQLHTTHIVTLSSYFHLSTTSTYNFGGDELIGPYDLS